MFQGRSSPFTTSFTKNWAEYETGFGNLSGSYFWLGNELIRRLTTTPAQLRIKLRDKTNYANYENFSLSCPADNYRPSVGAYASGNIGNVIHGVCGERNAVQIKTTIPTN